MFLKCSQCEKYKSLFWNFYKNNTHKNHFGVDYVCKPCRRGLNGEMSKKTRKEKIKKQEEKMVQDFKKELDNNKVFTDLSILQDMGFNLSQNVYTEVLNTTNCKTFQVVLDEIDIIKLERIQEKMDGIAAQSIFRLLLRCFYVLLRTRGQI